MLLSWPLGHNVVVVNVTIVKPHNIMDTLGPTKSVLIIEVSWFSRSVYVLKDYFGTLTKCVDYAGVLIFKCPH